MGKIIELKKIEDSFASAANYIKNLGWNNDIPCFYKINLKDDIPLEFLNTSAKKLNNKRKVKYFSKYIENGDYLKQFNNLNSAIITPDVDIVENAKKFSKTTRMEIWGSEGSWRGGGGGGGPVLRETQSLF